MTLGVIMLDTGFRRFPGDIGDAGSHQPPALFERVPGATAARVVGGIASLVDPEERRQALSPFLDAGRRLIDRGATALTTSCGFLVAYQRELADSLPVPVLSSALCMLPEIADGLRPGERIGILTFDAASLGHSHLRAAGFTGEASIAGLAPDCRFRREVLGDVAESSLEAREADVLEAADRLAEATPGLAAVLLECTNFPPHRAAIERRLRRPVHDIWDVVQRLQTGQRPAPRTLSS